MHTSITIVTAFFDIGRDNWQYNFTRTTKDYLTYFKNLAVLKNEMVIFSSKEFIPIIKKYRKNLPTHIIEIDFKKQYKNLIEKVQAILDSDTYRSLIPEDLRNNPEYNVAEYVVVTNLKFYFIKYATDICNNHQNTDLFAWIDFGFCRKTSTVNGIKDWRHNFDPNYIHLFTLKNPFILEDKTTMLHNALNNEVYIAGGMLVGSKELWRAIYPKIVVIQNYYLKRNITDDDQGTMLMMVCEYPNLFKIHYLKKSWFSGFKQFNNGSTYRNIFYKFKSLFKI
ncbi:WlaTC/HtrL family glycosyltransferase [Ignatzschineria larvae DSM 13226]|uniref:WlaTC/HtrL family glycosyltransferase n=1 Tax=Ignatzschineria larvae DSM 13226 TaxID=1111732 RepID=A0ABZ3C1K2_9GAMM|nr:WlaTC/HtrL family glycosyltransferase [Ignatzschineria larvae]